MRIGAMRTPSGTPWNRSRVIFKIRPAVRAQIRLISDKKIGSTKCLCTTQGMEKQESGWAQAACRLYHE